MNKLYIFTPVVLQKLSILLLLVVFLSSQYISIATAMTPEQQKIYQQGIGYFDLCGGSSSKESEGGEAEGLVFPDLNEDAMAASIDEFIKRENSNSRMNGLGKTIVESSKKNNVSPFLVVSIAYMESGLSSPSDYNVRNGNNSFGRTATSSQPNFQGARTWYYWSSVRASVDTEAAENNKPNSGGDITKYLSDVYRDLLDNNDLTGLISKYGDNVETYVANVKEWMGKMVSGTETDGGTTTDSSGETLNIMSVVRSYSLQSVMIQEVGKDTPVAAYKPHQAPITPASTMKLVIADTVLRSGINLNKTVSVSRDLYYDGSNDLGVNRISLKDALNKMLSKSSNVGANVLMKAMGGVGTFTQKANSYGYNDTLVKGYYDPSNRGKNTSTIADQVTAMNHIFSSDNNKYAIAQNALKDAAKNNNYYDVSDVANKWAGTDDVAGNVGLFNINGKQYVIGLYFTGDFEAAKSKRAIKNGSADLVNLIKNGGAPESTDECCDTGGGNGATSLRGKDTVEQTINFFVDQGLTPAQAIGIAANFMWETGGGETIDPLIAGPDPASAGVAFGVAQWTPPTNYSIDKKKVGISGSDAELLTQLQVVWAQIQGKGDIYNVNMLPGLKKQTTPGDAADYFRANFERCNTSYDSCTTKRVETANKVAREYNGSGASPSSSGECEGSSEQSGSVAAVIEAAKKMSDMKISYVYGGLHGPNLLKITNAAKLREIGADCSSSTSWALHQAGMYDSTTAQVSGSYESWGEAGEGEQMTIWANAEHVFIEFKNVPGMGHARFDTSQHSESGPRLVKWGSRTTSGFVPRHWPGT